MDYILGGLRAILTDRDKLVVTIGGVTALAAGVYTTRFVSYQTHSILHLKMWQNLLLI